MAKPLRVVKPGEKKPAARRARKKSITQAAANGTVLEQLVALRDRVAKAVEDPNCPARDLAALSRRLMEITKEIESLKARAEDEESASDDVEDEAFDASAI